MELPDLPQLGPYEIQELLGTGGMARVYRGLDQNLERPVAIKVLSQAAAAQPGFAEQFRQEARMIAGLHHPHIVQVYNFGQQDGYTYMVQELLPGPTLEQYLRDLSTRNRWPGRQDIVSIVSQLASALDVAHAAGIVHRDVKPGNALWNASGALVLTDFGIARHMFTQGTPNQSDTITIIGTPDYLSPEQARGLPGTQASDIYALGVVVYELLTGSVPFQGQTPQEVIYHHIHTPPPPLHNARPDVPPAVEEIVLQALAKEPTSRFASAGDLARAFKLAWPPKHTYVHARRSTASSDNRQQASIWAAAPPGIAHSNGQRVPAKIHSRTTIFSPEYILYTLLMPHKHRSQPRTEKIEMASTPQAARLRHNYWHSLPLTFGTMLALFMVVSTILSLQDDYMRIATTATSATPLAETPGTIPTARLLISNDLPAATPLPADNRPANLASQEGLAAPAPPVAAAGDTTTLTSQFTDLRTLIDTHTIGKWNSTDRRAWLRRLDAIEQALKENKLQQATTWLQEMRQALLRDAREGTLAPEVVEQMIRQIEAIADSHDIALPPVAMPVANER